jgi:hypothetical protein
VARPHSSVRRPPRAISRRGNRTSPSIAAHTACAPVTGMTSPTRNRPSATIKTSPRSFLAHANRRPSSAVRHRCHLDELPALYVHDVNVLRLAPLLTNLELTRAPVALAEPPAHRSTSSSGRRRAASGEPHSPLELQANQPLQDLH